MCSPVETNDAENSHSKVSVHFADITAISLWIVVAWEVQAKKLYSRAPISNHKDKDQDEAQKVAAEYTPTTKQATVADTYVISPLTLCLYLTAGCHLLHYKAIIYKNFFFSCSTLVSGLVPPSNETNCGPSQRKTLLASGASACRVPMDNRWTGA